MSPKRDPDPALDSLLSRIDRDLRTPTGREMCARADARTNKERDQIIADYPVFKASNGKNASLT